MKIIYLKNATNLQELKKIYFEMSKKWHPDVTGGNTEVMQIINNEYDYLKKILKNAEPKENESKKAYSENSYTMDAFRNIVNDLLKYPKITIEIIGSWLWISGSGTYTIKDEILKDKYNCKWSKGQKKWYWFDGIKDQEWTPKGGYLQNAINKYGIQKMESELRPELT